MQSFHHINAKTVDEAVTLLRTYKGKAKVIAGGTDLIGKLKDRILPAYPEVLVNIKTIPDMAYIKQDAGFLKIGALTRLREMAGSAIVKDRYSILAQAALSVGSPQIRNMGRSAAICVKMSDAGITGIPTRSAGKSCAVERAAARVWRCQVRTAITPS